MRSHTFTLRADDGAELFIYRWSPETAPKAVVQIAHGMAEHAGRYARLARTLTESGYAVYADDHRGHGRTARTSHDLGFFAERDGWRKCIDDLWLLNNRIADEFPGLPIVFLGHSMGSFMAQHFIGEHGDAVAGAIFSACPGRPPPLIDLVRIAARVERFRLGRRGGSGLLNYLIFGAFNRHFVPARTPYDWLSRDPVEVDKYAADPLCGFPVSVQMVIDVLDALREIRSTRLRVAIPKSLPIHIIAGDQDPVSARTKNLALLLRDYRGAGLRHVSHRFYPRARHELFNEINRDEVTKDVLAWLDAIVG
jgi:alpha-beta hydrolase superfamily lysophospholipase